MESCAYFFVQPGGPSRQLGGNYLLVFTLVPNVHENSKKKKIISNSAIASVFEVMKETQEKNVNIFVINFHTMFGLKVLNIDGYRMREDLNSFDQTT